MLNKQQIRELLQGLNANPGWIWLEDKINEHIDKKRTRLENCTDYELDKIQGELKGLRFARQKIDEEIKVLRDENNGTT